MRGPVAALTICLLAAMAMKAQEAQGPTAPKAQKSYQEGLEWARHRMYPAAIDAMKKANKQDGGQCDACATKIIEYGIESDDFKAADAAAQQLIADAKSPKEAAVAHLERGTVQYREAMDRKKNDCYAEADREFQATLAAYPNVPSACFYDGIALAHLNRDTDAKAAFAKFLTIAPKDAVERARAQRFLENIDLARARMAPPFSVTTLEGRQVSLDSLAGKVVLIDFWATWCGPCREALPKIRDIAQKFSAEPLVVLSVSLDKDDGAWREFVAKNKMTWLQYRDASGEMARLFGVVEIPNTFTIDADGVLQEEHVGSDADFQGKMKKLIAHARELEEAPQVAMKPGA
ncbi:MAG TPA: TlpA disulfide reductase family protein [Acidobacteriaceae bacterium]|nr:TlpA disulfide reductase family protein [Acidobacteriaceae bacterium]